MKQTALIWAKLSNLPSMLVVRLPTQKQPNVNQGDQPLTLYVQSALPAPAQPTAVYAATQSRAYQRTLDLSFGVFFGLYGFMTILSLMLLTNGITNTLSILHVWIVGLFVPNVITFILARKLSAALSSRLSIRTARIIALVVSMAISFVVGFALLLTVLMLYYVTVFTPEFITSAHSDLNHWLALAYQSCIYATTSILSPIYTILCGTFAAYIGVYVGNGKNIDLTRRDKFVPPLRFPIFHGAWQQFKAAYFTFDRPLKQRNLATRVALLLTIALFGLWGAFSMDDQSSSGLILGFFIGSVFGFVTIAISLMIGGTLKGMYALFIRPPVSSPAPPNLKRTVLNAVKMGIFYTILSAVILTTLAWFDNTAKEISFLNDLIEGIPSMAWFVGLPAFMIGGGTAIFQYFSMRLISHRKAAL